MPVSVCKKSSANVTNLQHVKNGVHHRDIFANEDGGPPMTSCIISVNNHESGGTKVKAPCSGHFIITEGQISIEDHSKPGVILVLGPGDVGRVEKGTISTMSSPTTGKMFYVSQHEFGIDAKKEVAL